MIKKSQLLLVTLALLSISASSVWAGAWTMPAGKLYTRVAYSEYDSQRFFNENGTSHRYAPNEDYKAELRGKVPRNFDYDEQTWSVYAEYGLLDKLTLIGSLDYKETEWTYQGDPGTASLIDKTAKSSGLGDLNFGLRYRLLATQSGALSLQAMYKTGECYDEEDENFGTDIQRGDGQDDFEMRLQYGQSLYPLIPGYFNVEAGYRWRTQQYADEFTYLLEAGVDITKALYLRTKLDGFANLGNGDSGPTGSYTEIDSNPYEVDLGKLEVTVGYKIIPQLSLEASYFNELYGASTTKGDTWSLALAATLF
ncbi:MAG: hypothetical protein RBR22_09010 [Desulfuromonas sp.]|nr:hypothetical protein [Desulfuromonas sp.]